METLNHEPVTKQELDTKIAELDAMIRAMDIRLSTKVDELDRRLSTLEERIIGNLDEIKKDVHRSYNIRHIIDMYWIQKVGHISTRS